MGEGWNPTWAHWEGNKGKKRNDENWFPTLKPRKRSIPKFNFMLILPFSPFLCFWLFNSWPVSLSRRWRGYETCCERSNVIWGECSWSCAGNERENRKSHKSLFLLFSLSTQQSHFRQSSPTRAHTHDFFSALSFNIYILTYNIDSFISATLTINFGKKTLYSLCTVLKFRKSVQAIGSRESPRMTMWKGNWITALSTCCRRERATIKIFEIFSINYSALQKSSWRRKLCKLNSMCHSTERKNETKWSSKIRLIDTTQ